MKNQIFASTLLGALMLSSSVYALDARSNAVSAAPLIKTTAPPGFCSKMFSLCIAGQQSACSNYFNHCTVRPRNFDVLGPN